MTEPVRPLRVLVIVGSTRTGSYTAAAARFAASAVKSAGHQAHVIDPRARPLPFADPSFHENPLDNPDPNARALIQAARLADAFVLASPVYHNGYSGILKNTLDLLTIDEFYHKPVGLVVHGPKLTAVQVCDQLRVVVRGLYGLCVPEQAVTTPGDYTAGEGGRPVLADDAVRARVASVATAALKFARR